MDPVVLVMAKDQAAAQVRDLVRKVEVTAEVIELGTAVAVSS